MEKKWHAVYTRSRCEKKVASVFQRREVEHYCPLNRVMKQWSDRKKVILEPLFTSYVFVRASEKEISFIKQLSSDIVNFVYWLGSPAVITDHEIEAIKRFLGEYTNVRAEKIDVQVSDRVRITQGPLLNAEGKVTYIHKNRARVELPSLGYMMYAEVNVSKVEVLDHPYRLRNMVS